MRPGCMNKSPVELDIRGGFVNSLVFVVYAVLVAFVSLRPMSGSTIDPWDKVLHFVTYGQPLAAKIAAEASAMAVLSIKSRLPVFSQDHDISRIGPQRPFCRNPPKYSGEWKNTQRGGLL